ncbi:MAG: tyrosine-type recombinase/integrase [Clostridia bacterium]|nr:tyrosine-type recombinase/integrase [Clostridia bacterium]
MKNPNGYGTITKLTGNRRRPYVIKEGHTGHQHPIGYASTKEEALILLAQYNCNPWNLDTEKTTLSELYALWLEKRAAKYKPAARNALKSAYSHCKQLYKKPYKSIRTWQMQDCIDGCGLGYASQSAIKNLFRHLDRFALEMDIIEKSHASLLTSESIPPTTRTVFSEAETNLLWQMEDVPYADCALFLLYTGFRISEMLSLTLQSVNMEEETLTGGMKTDAGRNRIVPIHPKIKHIVERHMQNSATGYLFENNGKPFSQTQFRRGWKRLMQALSMTHTPHECRHTFRSRLDTAGANKVCIDRLMGHTSPGTGERVYTHKTVEELRKNLLLITN